MKKNFFFYFYIVSFFIGYYYCFIYKLLYLELFKFLWKYKIIPVAKIIVYAINPARFRAGNPKTIEGFKPMFILPDWVFWLMLVIVLILVAIFIYTARNYENGNLSTENLLWLWDFTNYSGVIFYLSTFIMISWLGGIFGLIVKLNALLVLFILTKVLWPLYIDKMLEDKWKYLVLFSLFIIFIYTCILFWICLQLYLNACLAVDIKYIYLVGVPVAVCFYRTYDLWLDIYF